MKIPRGLPAACLLLAVVILAGCGPLGVSSNGTPQQITISVPTPTFSFSMSDGNSPTATSSGTAAPSATVPAAPEPVSLTFEVSLPAPQGDVSLHIGEAEYPMTAVTEYLFTSPPIQLATGDLIEYYYADAETRTESRTLTVTGPDMVRDGLPWLSSPRTPVPGALWGHAVMDAGGFIINATRDGSLGETMDAMVEDAAEWFAYDYYWAYGDYTIPEILDETTMGLEERGDKPARPEDIARMVDLAHERGLKYFLITELEWQVTPEEAASLGSDWDAYFEYLNEKWTAGQEYTFEMGRRISQDPSDPEVRAWWDSWFAGFTGFMLHTAWLAEENDIEMMALGKQVIAAMQPVLEPEWRALITKVREVYHGSLCQVIWANNWTEPADIPWADALDYLVLYPWPDLTRTPAPALGELRDAMTALNAELYDRYWELYGKPIVFLTTFQSRTQAAQGHWFEPMASAPEVGRDWNAQADLYETFFRTAADAPWFGGVITWGYWIEPFFNPKYSFDKSSSVRLKPASLVFRKWVALLSEQG